MSDEEIPAQPPASDAPEEMASPGGFVPPSIEELDGLFEQFEIHELISVGGMGAVYKAWQPKLERYVALKVLPPGAGGELGFDERFAAEARTLAKLKHTNIVSVHDFGEAGPYHYFAMEFVDGSTLFDMLQEKPLSHDKALDIFYQVCDALSYAHDNGVIHRDIKSANILVGSDGIVKVVDFGLAKIRKAPGVIREADEPGALMGTPDYAAPELLKPGASVDQRADVFALGVLFYESLTGRTIGKEWVPPSKVVGSAPPIDSVILKAVSQDREKRYQSVAQFRASLDQVLKMSGGRRRGVPPKAKAAVRGAAGAKPVAASFAQKKPGNPFFWVLVVVVAAGGILIYMSATSEGDGSEGRTETVSQPRKDPLAVTNLPDENSAEEADPIVPEDPPASEPVPETPADPTPPSETASTPVGALRAEFDERFESEVSALFAKHLSDLDEKYLDALAKAASEVTGDDQGALLEEALRVQEKRPLPDSDEAGLSAAVVKLRTIYRSQRGKVVAAKNGRAQKLGEEFMKRYGDLGIKLLSEDDEAGAEAAAAARKELSGLMFEWEVTDETAGSPSSVVQPTSTTPDDPAPPATSGGAAATHKSFAASPRNAVPMGDGETGFGIFAGTSGKYDNGRDHVDVIPSEGSRRWTLNAKDGSEEPTVHAFGIYYSHPRLDISEATFTTYVWDPSSEIKRHVETNRGFAMISGMAGHWGRDEIFEIEAARNGYWQSKGDTRRHRSTRAIVTTVEFPATRMPKLDATTYSWKTGEPPVKMIHKDAGFCVLTMIHGPFRGGGERIQLEIGDDGYWYLGKTSKQAGTAATAVAFEFAD